MGDDELNEEEQYQAGMTFLGDVASALIERDILAENFERPTLVLQDVINTILIYSDAPEELPVELLTIIVDDLIYGRVVRKPSEAQIEKEVSGFSEWLKDAQADFGATTEENTTPEEETN